MGTFKFFKYISIYNKNLIGGIIIYGGTIFFTISSVILYFKRLILDNEKLAISLKITMG